MGFFFMTGCSSMEVNTAKDPQANFANYKTYAWAPEALAPGQAASVFDATVKSDVDQQLLAKGWTKVPVKDADLLISYTAKTRNNVSYGVAPGYSGWYGGVVPYVTKQGTLTLHFTDPKSRQVVWEGIATDTVGDAGSNQKQVAEAVKKVLEKYPLA